MNKDKISLLERISSSVVTFWFFVALWILARALRHFH